MQLAFSTNAFTGFTLEQALDAIARTGYRGAEILADRPHLWPPDVDAARVAAVRAHAAKLGLALCNVNGFTMKGVGDTYHPSWIEADDARREQRVKHTADCLKIAAGLGSPSVSTEPGGPVKGTIEARGKEYALFARTLERVLPVAAETNVRLLIEPEPGLLFEEMDGITAFLEDMDHPALGVNFDAGHFFCVGEDPAGLVRAYASFLEHVHLEDIAANRVHRHLIPGQGAMDFGALFDALKDVGYRGFVTVELYPYDTEPERAAEEAFRHLAPYFEGTL